jgi:hypothetical protein
VRFPLSFSLSTLLLTLSFFLQPSVKPGRQSPSSVEAAGTATCPFSFVSLFFPPVDISSRRLGDEGSAYYVSRLAINRLLAADDTRVSSLLSNPSEPPTPLLPLYAALLHHLDVKDAPALIDKLYSPSSFASSSALSSSLDSVHSSLSSDFTAVETARKLWVTEAARVVLSFAFDPFLAADSTSKETALSILSEAASSLVALVARLVSSANLDVRRTVLTLGGGMWTSEGYRDLLVEGLREKGMEFRDVVVVKSAAEEGARALLAQDEAET